VLTYIVLDSEHELLATVEMQEGAKPIDVWSDCVFDMDEGPEREVLMHMPVSFHCVH
jgi:hypothetical protein